MTHEISLEEIEAAESVYYLFFNGGKKYIMWGKVDADGYWIDSSWVNYESIEYFGLDGVECE